MAAADVALVGALGRLVAAARARDRLARPWRGAPTRGGDQVARAAARAVSIRIIRIRIVAAYAAGATVEQIAAAADRSVQAVRVVLHNATAPRP